MRTDIRVADITHLAKQKIVPVSTLVEVCHTCNEKCIHCCLEEHSSTGLALNQYEKLFDQMVEAGTLFVILTGGEPFTRMDFMGIVKAARHRRLSVTIFTNGTLLTEEIMRDLKKLHVQEVHISIYGAKEKTHDAITTIKGSFRKSMSSLIKLKELNITARIKCPIMSINALEVPDIKILARELGVDVQFTAVITSKNDGDHSTQDLRLSVEQARNILVDGEVDKHSASPLRACDCLDHIPCDVAFNGGAIDPEGNVFVCNQLRIKGGNILKSSLLQIWSGSPEFQRLRSIRLKDLTACRNCEIFAFCTRCPGLALLEDGDLLGCSTIARRNAMIRSELGVYSHHPHIFGHLSEKGGD